jgi:hypothetical protein
MKQLRIYTAIVTTLLLLSCAESSDPVVGSTGDTNIPNLSFIVDTTYLDAANSRLISKGTVKNNGSSQVSSPWYVECQFYTNSSKTTKLGGNSTQIGVPLSNGQSTFWTITYSSSNVNVNDYPNFAVGDLRGIYK